MEAKTITQDAGRVPRSTADWLSLNRRLRASLAVLQYDSMSFLLVLVLCKATIVLGNIT